MKPIAIKKTSFFIALALCCALEAKAQFYLDSLFIERFENGVWEPDTLVKFEYKNLDTAFLTTEEYSVYEPGTSNRRLLRRINESRNPKGIVIHIEIWDTLSQSWKQIEVTETTFLKPGLNTYSETRVLSPNQNWYKKSSDSVCCNTQGQLFLHFSRSFNEDGSLSSALRKLYAHGVGSVAYIITQRDSSGVWLPLDSVQYNLPGLDVRLDNFLWVDTLDTYSLFSEQLYVYGGNGDFNDVFYYHYAYGQKSPGIRRSYSFEKHIEWHSIVFPKNRQTALRMEHRLNSYLDTRETHQGWDSVSRAWFFYSEGLNSLRSLNKLEFQVYPNPATEEIYVSGERGERFAIRLTDTKGAVIVEKEMHDGICRIDVSTMYAGIYFLSVATEGNYWSTRVVIN